MEDRPAELSASSAAPSDGPVRPLTDPAIARAGPRHRSQQETIAGATTTCGHVERAAVAQERHASDVATVGLRGVPGAGIDACHEVEQRSRAVVADAGSCPGGVVGEGGTSRPAQSIAARSSTVKSEGWVATTPEVWPGASTTDLTLPMSCDAGGEAATARLEVRLVHATGATGGEVCSANSSARRS